MKNNSKKTIMLGLGLDGKDKHVRITRGNNFQLYGGSEDTHANMQEKAIKFNEQLDRKGKNLDEITKSEFEDIASKVGMHIPGRNS